uniref:Alpha,alpha-trehalose-phosphate synthase (UDP-forming) n=2 Tax=Grammatophora oceanica TaxID=210454 RepID=A0A7S1UMF2_9STRA|mmetsp:Transcript_11760/g.17270  ORF Transcript_11760/g.17270 Transcript_11760/m.17270 type:complete len:1198 (+) Transcript_11760:139-3732(+)|eukprot:CAMPEP_0194048402 /NCGR_PEP_ID=MMETSP0009_2-20130614/27183_1 /TAXON_ID=210454 /ORGANISM="Grammatophora oceanica, Strain CCMP 410" /LENGTH=1197 /DNA_ID=CAMNT_0038694253 /DNA_START=121 /DNA_END=3714 /DNA_ORIENTATION=+
MDGSSVAHTNFRVRCETLGHGEDVYLVRSDDVNLARAVPLYTRTSTYPWYSTLKPLTVTLPSERILKDPSAPKHTKFLYYSYAIFRSGVFHRWEQLSDAPTELMEGKQQDDNMAVETSSDERRHHHELPLRLLHNRELYVVNDVLGKTMGPPDIDHIREQSEPQMKKAESLLSAKENSSNSIGRRMDRGSRGSMTSDNKKHVGFAPTPPPFHPKGPMVNKQPVHLNSTDGLVVVSAFLPVVLTRSDDGQWSADWDYEMLLSMQTHLRVTRVGIVKWRGWHGNQGAGGSPEGGVPLEERDLVEACLVPFNCVPVWVEPKLFGEMYNGFCKGVLWPVLHNVTSVYADDEEVMESKGGTPNAMSDQQFSEYSMDDVEQGPIHGDGGKEAELWSSYTAVNRRFADTVVQCFNEGDLVWIHGFHLLILPSYLTRRIPMAKIGMFLHTPFPSSEIFRTIWCREDILRGMLNADQVGFHLYEYARHFLTCCRRLLGMNYGMIPDSAGGHTLAIDSNGRHVAVTSIHAGIEPPVLNQILMHTVTLEKANSIRHQFSGKVIFCAIDRLESLKGIPLKLLGLERFLRRCKEWVGKIVLVQVGISAYERGDDYVKTKKEVNELVTRVNEMWPGTVHFQECAESEMRLQQRMALLRAADVALVTPIRDGLNLVPLEFTIAHQDALTELGKKDGRKRGLCILSEFSSCTRVMRGALHVNPWKVSEIATAFHSALVISEDERMRRISTALEFVTRVTTQRWALAVMLDLKGVHKNLNPLQNAGAGLGLGYRRLGMDTDFIPLDTSTVIKGYKDARARLILVDYGGTIVVNDNLDSLMRFQMVQQTRTPSLPAPEMVETLTKLCEDKRNTVFVVSGKERHSITKTLGHIPNLGLAAEHGMFISWPTKKSLSKRRWETLVTEGDRSWRPLAISIMDVYQSRTHGSYIEETEMKVLWQYRDADPEFGYLQAKELEDHLANVLRNYAVDILHTGMEEGGYVEVRPKGVNKGVLAMHVIRNFTNLSTKARLDFALAIGDDHCDEPMLSVMRQIGRRVRAARLAKRGEDPLPDLPSTITMVDVSSVDDYVAQNLRCYTCTVGKKPSAAASYLHEVAEVQELLDSLVKMSTRDQKYYSSVDLFQAGQNQYPTSPTPISPTWQVNTSTSLTNMSGPMVKSRSLADMVDLDGPANKLTSRWLQISSMDETVDEEEDENFF